MVMHRLKLKYERKFANLEINTTKYYNHNSLAQRLAGREHFFTFVFLCLSVYIKNKSITIILSYTQFFKCLL